MDRMVTAVIAGAERYLNYSIEIMFDMMDKFGTLQTALDAIQKDGKEAFEVVRWFAIRMANDGELCRREAGYDPLPMVQESDISLRMSPYDFETLRAAVVDAIGAGYRREIEDEDKERDLGLEELNAKKAVAGA